MAARLGVAFAAHYILPTYHNNGNNCIHLFAIQTRKQFHDTLVKMASDFREVQMFFMGK